MSSSAAPFGEFNFECPSCKPLPAATADFDIPRNMRCERRAPICGGDMSKIHIITRARLNRATQKVASELNRRGLWTDRLREVPVVLVPVGVAYGWIWYGGTGEICVPRVSLLKLHDFLTGSYTSLADVLRHEFGHAVTDTHRGIFRSRRFTMAFGRSHESNDRSEYAPATHISRYAATNPSEDFAENFMHFIRCRGTLPSKYAAPAIRRKWEFICDLCHAIQNGRSRW